MSKAIIMQTTGGPEVLQWSDYDPGDPAAGEVRIVHQAVGLNFIDVYHRTGLYPLPALPAIPGLEGAGLVEAVGPEVTAFKPGDRVAYAGVPPGAYAQVRNIPAHRLVILPDAISFRTGAAMMLQGMTARYLLKGCYTVTKGSTILIHAAAGGVGSIVCQWASSLGGTVIGTVGSEEKAELAQKNGCRYPILYRKADLASMVKEITNGRGVDVVYDSIGKTTFMASLDCLKDRKSVV
jgi:NADPH2:quinone reductase